MSEGWAGGRGKVWAHQMSGKQGERGRKESWAWFQVKMWWEDENEKGNWEEQGIKDPKKHYSEL